MNESKKFNAILCDTSTLKTYTKYSITVKYNN